MTKLVKPEMVTDNPNFSSGPCSKFPDWSLQALQGGAFGRSHRSSLGKEKLKLAISKTHKLLKLPDSYRIGIVPASDTGAVEMALWSMLGCRGVDVLAWESFSAGWVTDILSHLKIKNARALEADYGKLPDLSQVNFKNDVVFAWNGTTSGVRVPDGNWIDAKREGLTICDATSAIFAQKLPWDKLDVVTFSWQKVMGGEAAHGMIIVSPRAIERLESYVPPRPLPKIFRMTKKGKLIEGIFEGETINTPSMIAVEDYLAALNWAETIGGEAALQERADANLQILKDWVANTPWVGFLCEEEENLSNTSVCFKIIDEEVLALPEEKQAEIAKKIVKLLEKEGIAYDIGAYRDAPHGLRLWAGGTIETHNLRTLTIWLDWAFASVTQK